MQKDELVLSDVHLQVKSDKSIDYCVSRFYFTEDIYTDRKKRCAESVSATCNDEKTVTENDEFHSDAQKRKRSSPIHIKDSQKQNKHDKSAKGVDDQSSEAGDSSNSYKEAESIESNSNQNKPLNLQSGIKFTSTKTEEKDGQTSVECSRSVKLRTTVRLDRDRATDAPNKTDRDEDGDIIVKRRKRKLDDYSACSVITIAHKLETNLENVGLQIWLASLYMADFITSNKNTFTGKKILDLGAGVAMTSIVAALYADNVMCTDIGKEILDLAQHNLEINNTKECVNFSVRELDWFDSKFISDEENEDCYKELQSDEDLMSCDIVISADVIYDDDITDALFRTVYALMITTHIDTWYISLEKRYLFTIGDLDVVCPAYRHFRECLTQLEEMSDDIVFTVCLVEDIQQCFKYDRTKQLELWKVTSKRKEPNEGLLK